MSVIFFKNVTPYICFVNKKERAKAGKKRCEILQLTLSPRGRVKIKTEL